MTFILIITIVLLYSVINSYQCPLVLYKFSLYCCWFRSVTEIIPFFILIPTLFCICVFGKSFEGKEEKFYIDFEIRSTILKNLSIYWYAVSTLFWN
jgi:hypothetical protein